MPSDNIEHILRQMKEAEDKRRGYADFFDWPIDRSRGELGVVEALAEALHGKGSAFFTQVKSRRRGQDPPDVEALDFDGRRVAVEVSELVDGSAIQASKSGSQYVTARWPRTRFLGELRERLRAKLGRFQQLKDGPYPGGYVVVLYTDERALMRFHVTQYLKGEVFPEIEQTHRVFLLLSYDPMVKGYPVFELARGV